MSRYTHSDDSSTDNDQYDLNAERIAAEEDDVLFAITREEDTPTTIVLKAVMQALIGIALGYAISKAAEKVTAALLDFLNN